MFASFQANDPDGNVFIGEYRSYDATGQMDSSGTYNAGKRHCGRPQKRQYR